MKAAISDSSSTMIQSNWKEGKEGERKVRGRKKERKRRVERTGRREMTKNQRRWRGGSRKRMDEKRRWRGKGRMKKNSFKYYAITGLGMRPDHQHVRYYMCT